MKCKPIIGIPIFITGLLSFSAAAIAQLPEGWIEEPAIDGSTIYVDPKSEARIVVRSAPSNSDSDVRTYLTRLIPSVANTPICAGLAQAPIEQDGTLFSVNATSDIASCSLFGIKEEDLRIALAIEPRGSNAGAGDIARSLLVGTSASQSPTPQLGQEEKVNSDGLKAKLLLKRFQPIIDRYPSCRAVV